MYGRARRILSLVPARSAGSDASNGSTSGDEAKSVESSDAPSLDSSFERLDILGSSTSSTSLSEEEVEPSEVEQEAFQVPLTPILNAVFPSPTQCNYDAIPSISSLRSVPSVQPSTSMTIATPLTTRGQRKRSAPSVSVNRVKRPRIKKLNLRFRWKKVSFQHRADIPDPTFEDEVPVNWSPLDYFYRFFHRDMISHIMTNTNLYSVQETGKSIKVSEEEILDFLAINILMGIVVLPSYKDYWKSSFRYGKIADVMPLKRFQQIRRFIHFTDNTQADTSDRYYKVRPLIESIRAQCLSIEEENAFSIDEMVIPYKGKKAGSRRQYNPNKPSKWGFKNLVRAGVSGIIYDFLLYGGDDTFRGVQFTDTEESLGVGGKIVLALCKTIRKQACSVYFDNYFTSLELVYILRENYGIFSLGTVRKNRLKDAERKMTNDKLLKKKGRGAFTQVVCNENKLSVVKWFDNKHVRLVSSSAESRKVVSTYHVHKLSSITTAIWEVWIWRIC